MELNRGDVTRVGLLNGEEYHSRYGPVMVSLNARVPGDFSLSVLINSRMLFLSNIYIYLIFKGISSGKIVV